MKHGLFHFRNSFGQFEWMVCTVFSQSLIIQYISKAVTSSMNTDEFLHSTTVADDDDIKNNINADNDKLTLPSF